MKYSLRPYQYDLVEKIRKAYRDGFRAPLLQSATGSGKTVMFSYITENAAKKGNKIIILVHRQELLHQASNKLWESGVQHGCISPHHTITHDNVQVASVQTLIRRIKNNKILINPNMIIIDECAHAVAASWREVLEYYKNSLLLGVTATPERLDGKGLGIKSGGYFDILIPGPSPKELIEQGYISKPVVYAPPGADPSKLHTRFGDYKTDEVDDLMNNPVIIGSAIEHYNKICPGVPAIAFCVTIKRAEQTCELFNDAGISSAVIDGTLSYSDRKGVLYDFESGKTKVLVSVDIVSEGFDLPIVTAGIMLRPTQSTSLYLQQVGRTMRPHPSKTCSYILDHVGNVYRHGFPDDDRDWSLDGETRTKSKKDQDPSISIVQCQKCYYVFNRREQCCPMCGTVPELKTRQIEERDGELKEISDEEKERIRIERKREIGKARTREQLEEIAKARGYKHGWVDIILQSRKARGIPVRQE